MEQRKEAVELLKLLSTVRQDDPNYPTFTRRLALLELKLRQAGFSTDFLLGEYAGRFIQKFKES
jgi:hypothetical protein